MFYELTILLLLIAAPVCFVTGRWVQWRADTYTVARLYSRSMRQREALARVVAAIKAGENPDIPQDDVFAELVWAGREAEKEIDK